MKRVVLIFLFISLGIFAKAQKETIIPKYPKNAIYVEIWGAGGNFNYTLNYERQLFISYDEKIKGNIRVGANIPLGFIGGIGTYPGLFNLCLGNKYCFELGIGGVLIYDYGVAYGAVTSVLGFRYQDPEASGFLFRAGLTPTFGEKKGGLFGSIVGLSAGYSF